MKLIVKKLFNRYHALTIGAAVLLLVLLLAPQVSLADTEIGGFALSAITSFFGHLALFIAETLGTLVLLPLINLVIWILSYNHFLDNNAVSIGWPLVRDLCNMFFVVILLFIAFGTILNIQSYHYKATFFKLILMAVLVNFSKTIMGLAIDFAQVVMLTFVNAFKDAAATNLMYAFGIRDMLKLDTLGENFSRTEVAGITILAVILVVVSIGLMLAYAAVLLWRIISLWVLVILSPVAFLMSAFPSGQKYASEIWTKFTEQLTTGVILAFFMWLSFTIMSAGYDPVQQTTSATYILSGLSQQSGDAALQRGVAKESEITNDVQWNRLYTFIIAVALLLLALQYAQKAGGFAGSFAGKVSGKLSQIGTTAAKVIGSPAIGAYKLAGWGIKSVPDKLDQLLIKGQRRLGIKKPVSLRPKVWKAAIERYSKERESQWYTGVPEGMTDNLLKMFTGRRSKYAEIAYDARTHEKEREISEGGELQEQLRAYLKKDHLETYTGTNRRGEQVTKYRVKRGHENEAEAILAILTKNHDLNELFKDDDIGAAYDHRYNAMGVRDMLRDLFQHQGEEDAARVGKDLSLIGFANKDAHLYGLGTVDVERDENIFFQEATKDKKGDEDIVRTSGHLITGETKEEKLAEMQRIRQAAMAQGASAEDKLKYQDLLDDNWQVNQGDLATAFILKVAGRAGLQNMTAQMLVDEAVRQYQAGDAEVISGDHQVGETIVDGAGETRRSFLTSRLSTTGKGILKAKAFDMQKEYHHMKDETKKYGLEPALDAIMQFVESDETDDVEKNRILTLIRTVTPELDRFMTGKGWEDNSEVIKMINRGRKTGRYDDDYLKNVRGSVVRRSKEARIAAHGDERHAEQDSMGHWQLGRNSVYDGDGIDYSNGNGAPVAGTPAPEPAAPDSSATPAQTNIKRKRQKLGKQRQALDKNRGSMRPEAADQVEADLANQEQILAKVDGSQQLISKIDALGKAIEKLATRVDGPSQEERASLLAQKSGLEKQASASIINHVVNNVTSGSSAALFSQPNWFKNTGTRLTFMRLLREQLNEVKNLDLKLYRVIMNQLRKNFTNLDQEFGNLQETTTNEEEIKRFIEGNS